MERKKIAVVTGASSGLGREFVRLIDQKLKSVDEIWVVARRKDRLEELAKEGTIPLVSFVWDLEKDDWIEKLEQILEEKQPRV